MTSRASVSEFEAVFVMLQKIGFAKTTFFAYILPPFVCQHLMGVLVQRDGTRFYRLALLPVTGWLAWRATTFVDVSGGDSIEVHMKGVLVTGMYSISMRSAVWAFARVRYRRHSPADDRNKSDPESIYTACWNSWDLLANPRGIGWNWSRGLVIPKPIFETNSRSIFVLLSAAGVALQILAFDACVQSIRVLSPELFGLPRGGSVFGQSLALVPGPLRSVLLMVLATLSAYFKLRGSYQLLAIVCITLFHQHPSQWPPLFDSPWLSTSLNELWGRRWHQLRRDVFLSLGGLQFGYLFGRLGGVFATFFISGIYHVIKLRCAGRGGDMVALMTFWVMNGVGVILERTWRRTTGRTVGGVWGWAWMVGWLTFWGAPMVDEYAKMGAFAPPSSLFVLEPSRVVVAFARRVLSTSS